MPLLPPDPVALIALGLAVAGTVFLFVSNWPKAYGMGILILVIFGFQAYDAWFRGTILTADWLVTDLGFRARPFLDGAQWWTPFSYMYMHAGFLHVFGNLFILLTAGPILEDRIGGRTFLVIYLLGGFAAAGAHLLLSTVGPEPRFIGAYVPAVGASGAIFGILAAVATLAPREKLPMTIPGFFFILWLPAFVVLFAFVAFNLVYMLSDLRAGAGSIAWYGHFAGLAVGLAAAFVLERRGVTFASAPAGGGRAPDVEKLRPLATTPDMTASLGRIEGMKGTTQDDATFRDLWLDRFFDKARCPRCQGALVRKGLTAESPCGYRLDFAQPKRKKGEGDEER